MKRTVFMFRKEDNQVKMNDVSKQVNVLFPTKYIVHLRYGRIISNGHLTSANICADFNEGSESKYF